MPSFADLLQASAAGALVLCLVAGPADARPKACTNHEIRTIVTDAFIIACTGKGGSVQCENGKQFCCKNNVCTDAGNLHLLSIGPGGSSRPPRATTDSGPGRFSPPSRPPQAGILEPGQGFNPQGPASTGSPLGTGGGVPPPPAQIR